MKEFIVISLCSIGLFFTVSGTVGIIRMPDVYSRIQCTSKVSGSSARADSIRSRPDRTRVATPGSLYTVKEKSKSAAVNGAPSCHFTLARTFQTVSIVPSGLTRQVPRSVESGSDASCGTHACRSFSTVR